jgi:sulfide:quinone oxidoreductase
MTPDLTHRRDRVVVIGGGVAAIEAILALRALTGDRLSIWQVTPGTELALRAPSVAAPFGFGGPPALPLAKFAREHGVTLIRGTLASVDTGRRLAMVDGAEAVPYDHLIVAIGALQRSALPGAITFGGPADVPEIEAVLADVAAGRARRLAFAVPLSVKWTLPLYELAIMAAVELRSRAADASITVVTPEAAPLELFGPEAGEAITRMLADRGIALRTGCSPIAFADFQLIVRSGDPQPADRVVALAAARGPAIDGLPVDTRGFIPADAHGRVPGCPDVYAAGDATSFPLRQGGLAAQQADAAAQSIAAKIGAIDRAEPFRPVLRGILLTGGSPLYLRAAVRNGSRVATALEGPSLRDDAYGQRPLWWPPAKVAGRYLAPLLATARPTALTTSPLEDVGHSPAPSGEDDALALALLVADEDARWEDYPQALHALDAARALGGGVLPEPYAEKYRTWSRRA